MAKHSRSKLKMTPELETVFSMAKNGQLRDWPTEEELNPTVKKVGTIGGSTFFIYVPMTVAGGNYPADAYRAIDEGDSVIQSALPKGYRLVAWYGAGGSGWLAQTRTKGGKGKKARKREEKMF